MGIELGTGIAADLSLGKTSFFPSIFFNFKGKNSFLKGSGAT